MKLLKVILKGALTSCDATQCLIWVNLVGDFNIGDISSEYEINLQRKRA